MYAVMKAYLFSSSMRIGGQKVKPPDEGPQRYIPVFDTKEQALVFTDGDEKHIATLEEFD